MDRKELIKKYIEFFKSKGHSEIKNSSLLPENDPTVLFTTAGMHPLVPFLLGEKHPQGKRLCNVQRCIRTGDIDEVGDTTHLTFFEMLGNWSLGDYFKEDAIKYTFEFHTKILKIPKERYAVTCFIGNKNASKDVEAANVWMSLGIPKERIAFLPENDNWWGPAGATGPCGPCTEQFYWKLNDIPAPKVFNPNDKNWVEIGNDVLMQYNKDEKGNYNLAKQKNIDFGGGVERTITLLSGLEDVYLSSAFLPIIKQIERLSGKRYGKDDGETRAIRIIADHIKASVFIISDGAVPSNSEQGYVLRRLIRRAIRYGKELGIEDNFTNSIAKSVFEIYDDYDILTKNKNKIIKELETEEKRFAETLKEGLKVAEKIFETKKPISKEKFVRLMQLPNHIDILKHLWEKKNEGKKYNISEVGITEKEIDNATITGKDGFLLYQSYGFPAEMILELAREKDLLFHRAEFRSELEKHQELSRTATAGRFKSGLADNSEATKKLHTACHLLNESLRVVLDKPDLHQKGSNITPERLRFDFNFDRKLTDEELKETEDLVNLKIQSNLQILCKIMPLEKAKKSGAHGVFDSKYGEDVKVYHIGSIGEEFSKEICAGPHVNNTGELGHFKIIKEESSSSGVRRIKAILE